MEAKTAQEKTTMSAMGMFASSWATTQKITQGAMKFMSNKLAMLRNQKAILVLLVNLVVVAALFAASISYKHAQCPMYNTIWPQTVGESIVEACKERMLSRRVTPFHMRSVGWRVNALCTPTGVLFNPMVRRDRMHYVTVYNTFRNRTVDDELFALMEAAHKTYGCLY